MILMGIVVVVLLVSGVMAFKGKGKPQGDPRTHPQSAPGLYQEALALQKNQQWLKAKETYQLLMSRYPDYEDMETIQKNLEQVNLQIIYSHGPSSKTIFYDVQSGDTLGKLAKKFSTTIDLIKKKNSLTSDTIQVGRELAIWTGVFNILIDKSQNILILKDGDEVIKVYDVATGANNITPVGSFKITSKLVNPVWFKAGVIIPPESPQNILGTRWLGFDLPGYGIHGTLEPDKLRQQLTAGCIRMRNEEVEELYSLIPIGTTVLVMD